MTRDYQLDGGDRRHPRGGGPDLSPRGTEGWDEISGEDSGSDPTYDPTHDPTYDPRPAEEGWDGWEGPRHQEAYDRPLDHRNYSFAPPPPPYAGYPPPYAYPPPYGYPGMAQPVNPALPMAGGVLTMLSGAVTLIWVALMFGDDAIFWLPLAASCVVVEVVFAVVAIIGGLFAMMKRFFAIAIIGAILGMISGGFFGVSGVLGLIGLILIAISHGAFQPSSGSRPPYGY